VNHSITRTAHAEGDDAARFHYEPILAWAVTATFNDEAYKQDAYCTPVTVSGAVQDENAVAIKLPDGRIDFPHNRVYPNELEAQRANTMAAESGVVTILVASARAIGRVQPVTPLITTWIYFDSLRLLRPTRFA